jgi:hypothetical protein
MQQVRPGVGEVCRHDARLAAPTIPEGLGMTAGCPYFRGCAWPCPPDVARAIAADNGAPLRVLVGLELVPLRLYDSEQTLLRALEQALHRPIPAYTGGAAALSPLGLLGRLNGGR